MINFMAIRSIGWRARRPRGGFALATCVAFAAAVPVVAAPSAVASSEMLAAIDRALRLGGCTDAVGQWIPVGAEAESRLVGIRRANRAARAMGALVGETFVLDDRARGGGLGVSDRALAAAERSAAAAAEQAFVAECDAIRVAITLAGPCEESVRQAVRSVRTRALDGVDRRLGAGVDVVAIVADTLPSVDDPAIVLRVANELARYAGAADELLEKLDEERAMRPRHLVSRVSIDPEEFEQEWRARLVSRIELAGRMAATTRDSLASIATMVGEPTSRRLRVAAALHRFPELRVDVAGDAQAAARDDAVLREAAALANFVEAEFSAERRVERLAETGEAEATRMAELRRRIDAARTRVVATLAGATSAPPAPEQARTP